MMFHPTYGLQGEAHESGLLVDELMAAIAFTCPQYWNPLGVIIAAAALAWAMGVAIAAAGAAAVTFAPVVLLLLKMVALLLPLGLGEDR